MAMVQFKFEENAVAAEAHGRSSLKCAVVIVPTRSRRSEGMVKNGTSTIIHANQQLYVSSLCYCLLGWRQDWAHIRAFFHYNLHFFSIIDIVSSVNYFRYVLLNDQETALARKQYHDSCVIVQETLNSQLNKMLDTGKLIAESYIYKYMGENMWPNATLEGFEMF